MHAARLTAEHPATAYAANTAHDLNARLNWLVAANAEAERRSRLFRTAREEEEMLLMLRPLTTERAFANFGVLLGTLPPAAILLRVLSLWPGDLPELSALLLLPILVICPLVGRLMGARLSQTLIADAERQSWPRTLFFTLVAAFVWAVATGTAGGALFFGFGAYFAAACALIVSLPAFALFTTLHRLLARGGMIDARHFWPLAVGVTSTITALILSPYLLPY